MSTSTTLRLAGLVAAIAVSLTVTSSAFAMPEGLTARQIAVAQTMTGPADNPAEVGTPAISNPPVVRADNPADVGTPVVSAPAVRVGDNPAEVGTPSNGLQPVVTTSSASSTGFSWQDAALGALVGLALACLAAFAIGTMRGRRLAIRA